MIRRTISMLPQIRGQQRLQIIFDSIFGPAKLRARQNIKLEGFYSSIQDMAFLRKKSENLLLEELIGSLPESATFVDCGANCGFYSALASSVLGESGMVISIEPSPREYKRLLYARESNASACRWITANCALGPTEGVAGIDSGIGHTGMNQIASKIPSGESKERSNKIIPVFIERLDRILDSATHERPTIDLVKIDVEGYELQVLRGLIAHLKTRRISKLVIEITDRFLRMNGDSKEMLFDFMKDHGYFPTVQSNAWQYDEVFVTK